MSKKKIAVVGYGTIGERCADGVLAQDDMELVGVVDVAPSLPIRALVESGKDVPIFCGLEEKVQGMKDAGVKVAGLIEDLLQEVDGVIDAASPGIGEKNLQLYKKHNVKATVQGGEARGKAEGMFHPMANYDQCKSVNSVQMLSCNTTGIARQAFTCDKAVGLSEMICLITRRAADVSETHKGPVDAIIPGEIPSHQGEDFAYISPDIKVVTSIVTVPVCFGHATTMVFELKKSATKDEIIEMFNNEPRIRIFRMADGFISTSHIFDYNRDCGRPRGDMYEVPVWEESIYLDRDNTRCFSINMIPQEAIVIPENIDALRCMLGMQDTAEEAMAATNRNLGLIK